MKSLEEIGNLMLTNTCSFVVQRVMHCWKRGCEPLDVGWWYMCVW